MIPEIATTKVNINQFNTVIHLVKTEYLLRTWVEKEEFWTTSIQPYIHPCLGIR